MTNTSKYRLPRLVLPMVAAALFGAQWLFGAFPMWFFTAPMNLLIVALWLLLLWEGFRRRATLPIVQYLLLGKKY